MAKFRTDDESESEEDENEERDIFNNEALENPRLEGATFSLNLGASRIEPNASANERNQLRDTITVECQKLNGRLFNGTVNFSEAKVKIFQAGLGLETGLLRSVKISFNTWQHRGRDSGNDIFVPLILDIFVTFPFLEFLFLIFIPKRFQKRKYLLFLKWLLFGYPKYKSCFFSFLGKRSQNIPKYPIFLCTN